MNGCNSCKLPIISAAFNPPQIRYVRRWPNSDGMALMRPLVHALSSSAEAALPDSTRVVWHNCLVISQLMAYPLCHGTGRRMNCNSIRAEVTGYCGRLVPRRPLYCWSCSAPAHGIIEGEQAITRRTE
jgi:hypothetical protein